MAENSVAGSLITRFEAQDDDSGSLGQVRYTIDGFGSEQFVINETSGHFYVGPCGTKTCLDYEVQDFYSLTCTAVDGGGDSIFPYSNQSPVDSDGYHSILALTGWLWFYRFDWVDDSFRDVGFMFDAGKATSVAVTITIEDVNDNAPVFEKTQYRRHIHHRALDFEPPLVVKVTHFPPDAAMVAVATIPDSPARYRFNAQLMAISWICLMKKLNFIVKLNDNRVVWFVTDMIH